MFPVPWDRKPTKGTTEDLLSTGQAGEVAGREVRV